MSRVIARLVNDDTEEIMDQFPADDLPKFIHNQVGRNMRISLNMMLSPNGKYLDLRIPTKAINQLPVCPLCQGTVGSCKDHPASEWKQAALTLNRYGTMVEEVQ